MIDVNETSYISNRNEWKYEIVGDSAYIIEVHERRWKYMKPHSSYNMKMRHLHRGQIS